MQQQYLEQRHIDLEHGRSCLALEKVYWDAIEALANDDGWVTWRDFFYIYVLPTKPCGVSLASHTRRTITQSLLSSFDANGHGEEN